MKLETISPQYAMQRSFLNVCPEIQFATCFTFQVMTGENIELLGWIFSRGHDC